MDSSLARYNFNGLSDIGTTRKVNQDSIYLNSNEGLFIVADGMGGHLGGEIASALCIERVVEFYQKNFNKLQHQTIEDCDLNEISSAAINSASKAIYQKSLEEPRLRGMGTTTTLIRFFGSSIHYAHVGDSRLYLLRCGLLYQITNDHSLIQEKLKSGQITKKDASRSRLKNIITRCVGYRESEVVDCGSLRLENNDFILLCSDGLHGQVSNKEIAKIILNDGTEAASSLISKANANGGKDNVSVIIIKIKG